MSERLGAVARFPSRWEWEQAINLYPPLVCYPLKVEWLSTQPDQDQESYPAPERSSRDGEAGKAPSAAEKLSSFAAEAGWGVRGQSSMGNTPHGRTGRPTALKELYALRFGAHPRTDRRAYVVYETPAGRSLWKPRSIMIWGPDLPPYAHCGMEELKLYLTEAPAAPKSGLSLWVRILESDRRQSEAFKKRRDTVRKQIRKVADEGRFLAAQQEDRAEWFKIDSEWRSKVKDLQDGVFTSDEVEAIIDPARKRSAGREGLS